MPTYLLTCAFRLGSLTVAFAAFAVLCSTVIAQTSAQTSARQPGIWEIKTRTLVDGKPIERSLTFERLSKDEQGKVQEAMSLRGMKLIKDGADGRVMQMCLSEKQAVKPPELFGATMRKSGCVATEVGRKDKTALYQFVCTGSMPGDGRGELTISSDKKYSGWTDVKQTESGKATRQIRNEVSARWLKSDCGKLTRTVERPS